MLSVRSLLHDLQLILIYEEMVQARLRRACTIPLSRPQRISLTPRKVSLRCVIHLLDHERRPAPRPSRLTARDP